MLRAALAVGRAVALGLLASACGRTGLVDDPPPPMTVDAGTMMPPVVHPVKSCSPAPLSVACGAAIASAAPGSEVWSTTLDAGMLQLLGPVAVDPNGGSYFLAADHGLSVKTVYALDACGAVRWQTPVDSVLVTSGYVAQVMIVGPRLLLIESGAIVALDLSTGAHAWTADVKAFAQQGGLGVAPGKVAGLGYSAASGDGAVFTVVANDHDAWVVLVDSTGAMRAVAMVANYVPGSRYTFDMQQMLVDSAGDLVLVGLGLGDSSKGDPVYTITATGVRQTRLPTWGRGSWLAAGPGFVTGSGMWMLGPDGALANRHQTGTVFIDWLGPTVIDSEGRPYVVGTEYGARPQAELRFRRLGQFGSDGAPQWSVLLDESIFAGPVLGDGAHLFVVTAASYDLGSPQHLEARALADGAQGWRVSLPDAGTRPTLFLLLTDAGLLLVNIGNQVHAYASGNARPPACAWWPTLKGGPDQGVKAIGPR